MADNAPVPEGAPKPPSPTPSGKGVEPSATPPRNPPAKKSLSGKLKVILSSVAKPPPVPTSEDPAKPSVPATPITMPPVPKKDALQIDVPPGAGTSDSTGKGAPPPLPEKSDPGGAETKSDPGKIKPPPLNPTASEESIFPPDDKNPPEREKTPENWKHLEPGELRPPQGDLQSLEVFSRTQRASEEAKSVPVVPAREPVKPPPLPPAKPVENTPKDIPN